MERSPSQKVWILALGAIAVALGSLWFAVGPDSASSADHASEARLTSSASRPEGSSSFVGGPGAPTPAPAAAMSGSPPSGDAEGRVEEALSEAEAQEAERIAEGMSRLVRDLQYSPGVPEPPQNIVRPSPEPWRSDPSRQGPPPVVDSVEPRSGRVAGGDRVVLRGRHLRVVEVMFGPAAGTIVAATGSAVTVETPRSAAGGVAIAVTNEDGTWAIDEVGFTFVE